MRKIKSKILTQVTVFVSISILLVSIAAIFALNKNMLFVLEETMGETVKMAAITIQGEMKEYKTTARFLAADVVLSQEIPDASDKNYGKVYDEILVRTAEISNEYGFVATYVTDKNGLEITTGNDFSDRDFFVKTKEKLLPFIADPIIDNITDTQIIYIAAPIIRDGVFAGVVFFGKDPVGFSRVLNDIKIGTNGTVCLIDKAGTTIAHPNRDYVRDKVNVLEMVKYDKSLIELAELEKKLIDGQSGFGKYIWENEKKYMSYAPLNNTNGWGIYVTTGKSEFLKSINVYFIAIIVVAAIIIYLSVISANYLSKKISLPVKLYAERLEEISNGNVYGETPRINSSDETDLLEKSTITLSETLSAMLTSFDNIVKGDYQTADTAKKYFINDFAAFNNITQYIRDRNDKILVEGLLLDMIMTINSYDSPNESVNAMLTLIRRFFHADRCIVYQFINGENELEITNEACDSEVAPRSDDAKIISVKSIQEIFVGIDFTRSYDKIDSIASHINRHSRYYSCLTDTDYPLIYSPIKKDLTTYIGMFIIENPKFNVNARKAWLVEHLSKFIADYIRKDSFIEKLQRLSYYDSLTGVKRRHTYREQLINGDSEKCNSLGIAHFDIKGLKTINDVRGADYGDSVIKKLANMLVDTFGENVYRIDGDEFAVIKKNIDEKTFEDEIASFKEKSSYEKDFTVTIGFSWNQIFGNMSVISADDQPFESVIAQNLEREILCGKFVIYLQPQIDLKTGVCTSAEALVRRYNSQRQIQPPIEFIPFYEREGIISKIDLFVFESICRQLKIWRDSGLKSSMKVAVNFSRITVLEDGILDKMLNICEKFDVEKSSIVIEITETASGACETLLSSVISSFSRNGFNVSLDDFGTGYSNLYSLKSSDFDEIKIDMSLIRNLNRDEKSKTLTKVALNICNEINNLTSVAEGIETKEQYEILQQLCCDKGQGYYFDKPLSIENFTDKYVFSKD